MFVCELSAHLSRERSRVRVRLDRLRDWDASGDFVNPAPFSVMEVSFRRPDRSTPTVTVQLLFPIPMVAPYAIINPDALGHKCPPA